MASSSADKKKLPFAFRVFRATVPVLETFAPFMARRMAFKAFFFPYRYELPEREQKLASEARTIAITYKGLQLRGYEWGTEGPVILFMHGWSSRTTQFIFLIRACLAAGYRCVGIDAPGHGYSEGKRSDVLEFGESLLAFSKIIGPVDYVVSHSMGGTAVLYAAKRGFTAKKAVILATPAVAEDILEVSRLKMNASVKTRDQLRKEIFNRYNEDISEYVAANVAKDAPMPPTLLIYDRDDEEAPAYHGELLNREIKGSILEYTSGLGHTRILKDPDTITRVIGFLTND
ncbi:MAG: alpha/beta hydrolase [Bacteroidota bacterium]